MTQPRVIAKYDDGLVLPVVAWDGREPLVIHAGAIESAYDVGSGVEFEMAATDPAAGGTKTRALALLRESGARMRNSDIAKDLGVAPQTCSAALASLIKDGTVDRHGVTYYATGALSIPRVVEEPEEEDDDIPTAEDVYAVVRSSRSIAAGPIAHQLGCSRIVVALLLDQLIEAGRIQQGGDYYMPA